MKLFAIAIAGAAVLGAVALRRATWPRALDPETARVVATARAEAERHGLRSPRVIRMELANKVWSVLVVGRPMVGLPIVYGGHAVVLIARDGAVLDYEPGL